MFRRQFVLFFMALMVSGAVYAAETLEKAIENSANYVVQNTRSGSVLAIVNIESGSSLLSEYIIEKMPDYIINRKNITVVDRNRLDYIQREINFQYSGNVSDETMVSIGKMIGAQIIVTGSVMEAGTVYNLSIKMLEVETAIMTGSHSIQIIHDETMQGFFGNSNVARIALMEAQQKRLQRESTISNVKNVLGFFSEGTYLGYLGSFQTPIGISFGKISEGTSMFIEAEIKPPSFGKFETSDSLHYNGTTVSSYGNTYKYEGKDTQFVLDVMAGFNLNIIKTLLWVNVGAGIHYTQQYKLFTETSSAFDTRQIWIKNDTTNNYKAAISAGIYLKIWYFYIQGKFKYIVTDQIDFTNYGLNHVNAGAGFVWQMK